MDGEVMGAIDEAADGERFVVADVSRDEAWISAPVSNATVLEQWQ
jgi:hypothetical protein